MSAVTPRNPLSTVRNLKVTTKEHEALLRLLEVASGDTGQSRRIADVLLAWWNSGSCGSYDLTTAWGLDDVLVEDVVTVFGLASRSHQYPDALCVPGVRS